MTISIVTTTFNAGTTIGEALQSVGLLDHVTEHLLVDAASTDNTLEVARNFPRVRILSEPDKGIYDGMNKGAELARGEWLLFLQGDDWLPKETMDAYRRAVERHPDAEIICGDCEAVRNVSGTWESVWSVDDITFKKLTIKNIALGEPMINARLIRKDTFQKLGGFSLAYPLASDRDFLLRCVEAGVKQVEIPIMTYRYRWHTGSSTMTEGNSLTAKLSLENQRIAKKYLLDAQGENRKILRKWHSRLMVQEAMNLLENYGWKKLLQVCKEEMNENPAWIFSFAFEIFRSLPGFLLRRGKTRSQVLVMGRMA